MMKELEGGFLGTITPDDRTNWHTSPPYRYSSTCLGRFRTTSRSTRRGRIRRKPAAGLGPLQRETATSQLDVRKFKKALLLDGPSGACNNTLSQWRDAGAAERGGFENR